MQQADMMRDADWKVISKSQRAKPSMPATGYPSLRSRRNGATAISMWSGRQSKMCRGGWTRSMAT